MAEDKKRIRVIAPITIVGTKETRIEGDSAFMSGEPGDKLERKGLGFWLRKWQICTSGEGRGAYHNTSRVFCPWSSVLFVEEKVARQSFNPGVAPQVAGADGSGVAG